MLYYAPFDAKVKSSWDSGKIWNWIQEWLSIRKQRVCPEGYRLIRHGV